MLCDKLKSERGKRQLSQMALSQIIGVSQQTIGSWEIGRTTPDYESLLKLASYFNVSTDYLLGRTNHTDKDSNPPGGQPSAMELSPEEESLLHAYRNATDRDKSIVDAVLQLKVYDEKK